MPRPARPWFRFYSEILESRKAHSLGRNYPHLYYDWTMLLALANIEQPRGFLPASMEDIAHALRLSDEIAAVHVGDLQLYGFIDVKRVGKINRLYMHKWHEWNPDSDANLTVARSKRNIKNAERTGKERAKNGERTPKERLDKDQEEDKEKETDQDAEKMRDANIFRLWEQAFLRPASPLDIEGLKDMEKEYPWDLIEYAFREASDLNKKSLRYVQRVCERQMAGDTDGPTNGTQLAKGRGVVAEPVDYARHHKPELVLD